MSEQKVQVVQRPELSAIVMKVPCSGHEVRRAWRELQPQLPELGGVNRELGFVFVPEWQWAGGVKELWVGIEVTAEVQPDNVPAGTELLVLPARTYATIHVRGNRPQMDQTYGALDAWFRKTGHVRDVREGSFSIEAGPLQPVNSFEVPADEIDWFDFHIYAPIRSDEEETNAMTNGNEETDIFLQNAAKRIHAQNSNVNDSSFSCVSAQRLRFENVNMTGLRISDANLSELEIDGAQLGSAFIRNIGMPPEGHPAYDPNAEQRPLRFENCHLNGSTFERCRLAGVTLTDCDIIGLTINGVRIDELLKHHAGGR